MDRWTSLPVAAGVLVCGLLLAGSQNLHLLNTDGVAYLRLAHYWATGQTHLMVSGYWGPLLSWLMVPWLWLGAEPLLVGRIALGLSGLLFWSGVVAVARAAGLRAGLVRLAAWISIPATVAWSVENIVPDLLVGGCMAMAAAQQMSPRWLEGGWRAAVCGATWALAYLAKAIAFPLAILVMGMFTAGWLVGSSSRRAAGRAGLLTFAVFLLGSLPWITTLSLKYHRPTFSTSGRIAHAVVGPPDAERSHPFGRTFHRPAPGRITAWEDPSDMAYAFWSPFESAAHLRHQGRLILQNAVTVVGLIAGLGLLGTPLLGLLVSFWPVGRWREVVGIQRWRWATGVVLLLGALYLPVYVKAVDQRYFHPAWPFVVAAGLGAAAFLAGGRSWKCREDEEGQLGADRHAGVIVPCLLALALAAPALPRMVLACQGIPDPASLYAQDLAQRLRQAGVSGPIAGNGLVAGGRVGLLTAFRIGQPWFGEGAGAGVEAFLQSGAELAVVQRRQPVARALAAAERVTNLDEFLFKDGEDPGLYLLQAFRLETGGTDRGQAGRTPP